MLYGFGRVCSGVLPSVLLPSEMSSEELLPDVLRRVRSGGLRSVCASGSEALCSGLRSMHHLCSGGLRSGLRLHLVLRGEELLPAEVPLPPSQVLQVLLPSPQELLCGVLLLGPLLRPGGLCSVRSGPEALCSGLRSVHDLCSGGLRSGLRLHLVLRGEELLPAEVPLPPSQVLQVLLPSPQELLCGVLLLGPLLCPGGLCSVRSGSEALCSGLRSVHDLCSGGLRSGLRLHLVLRGEELLPAEVPLPPSSLLQVLLPTPQELLCRVLLLDPLLCPGDLRSGGLRSVHDLCSGGLRSGLRLHLVLRGEELLPAEVPLPPSQELLRGILLRSGCLLCSGLRLWRDRSGERAVCGSSGSADCSGPGPGGPGSSEAEGLRTLRTRTLSGSLPREEAESSGSGVRVSGALPCCPKNLSSLKTKPDPSRVRLFFCARAPAKGRHGRTHRFLTNSYPFPHHVLTLPAIIRRDGAWPGTR